ncbi:MAG: amidohydrolase, imidazolonepropionase [Frondihabitans sp.]|nr:amidohydrolase, imidazolonepropionase [Frondihabitans sp.]
MPTSASAGSAFSITGAQVMDPEGAFLDRGTLTVDGGLFAGWGVSDPSGGVLDATGLWLIPGVYDCHSHITWNDFHQEDRERRSEEERDGQTAASLTLTLRGGVTSLRDGGGAPQRLQRAVADGDLAGPRLQISVDMLGADVAGSVARVSDAVRASLDKGAQWIKLIATAGVATPGDRLLDSNFSRDEIEAAARIAEAGGARLMVHTWGGDSLDWAIESGAGSLEHGIYLTEEQAARAARAGLTLVPTLTVYRQLRDMIVSGELPGVPLARVTDVLAAHERAVRRAQDAGLPLALGSDFSLPRQHGTNLTEIGTLIRAGLSSAEALLAATRNGALLLQDGGSGIIDTGERADAVLLDADPSDPATYEGVAHVVAVVKDGVLVHVGGLEATAIS